MKISSFGCVSKENNHSNFFFGKINRQVACFDDLFFYIFVSPIPHWDLNFKNSELNGSKLRHSME